MTQAPPRCVNHPAHNAVARCKQCHKALCQKCAKKMTPNSYKHIPYRLRTYKRFTFPNG